MKTRVLWMIDSLGHGGAERMTLSILEKLDREKFDIRVCALQVKHGNPIGRDIEKIGIPVDLVEIPVLRRLSNLPRLINYLRTHNPDIVHTQLEFADTLGSIVSKMLGKPSISTQHTLGNPQSGTAYWRNKITWFSLKNFCTKVIAVSEDTRNFYIKNAKIKDKKIITIYNGLDLSTFAAIGPDRVQEIRRSLGIPNESVVFTTVAVLREPKGIQYMIQAMPLIIHEIPNFYYLVVGGGEYEEALRQAAISMGGAEKIIFAGQRKDINEILQAIDCFVLPTLTEALPTVLIEAMAAKKSIIASKVGGVPEMVINEKNGLLLEPGDYKGLAQACIRLAKDKSLRDAMADEGNTIVHEKFNITTMIQAITKTYIEVLGNGKRN